MSLLEVRKNFITYSGRYDLMDRLTFANKGADFYIHAGQQYLDTLATMFKSESKYYHPLALGAWYLLVPDCRVVEEVYLANSDGARRGLNRISLEEYRRNYAGVSSNYNTGHCSSGAYCVANLRTTPQTQGQITLDSFYPVIIGDEYANIGVLINPPTSTEISAEVIGKFYQLKLVNDVDTNFWSEIYPQILVMSACRQLEISYRNTVGVKDWESSIAAELRGLELDFADQESTGIRKFVG